MTYYCDDCGKERGWDKVYPVNMEISPIFTQCSVCGEITDCRSIEDDKVVATIDEQAVLEAMKAINSLHSQGFVTVKDNKDSVLLRKGNIDVTIIIKQEVVC